MGKIDFEKMINRENTASVKWGMNKVVFGKDDILPMWVADMDFEPPKEVTAALYERLQHGIYGYTYVPETTTGALQKWLEKRHGWQIHPSHVLYSPGVVPTISLIINALTEKGDRVMLQSPVYAPFFSMIENNERVVVNSPLQLINGRFEIDYDDFEAKLKEGVKLFLLCNPHNPGGRVWREDELRKIADLCIQYDCLILSDEIHSDLILASNKHIPISSLEEHYRNSIITAVAPSKTFNLAGLQASAIIVSNPKLREAITSTQAALGLTSLNTFAVIGFEAAYTYGEEWLEELLHFLEGNVKTAMNYIEKEIPSITVMEPDGTYLLWMDCRKLELDDDKLQKLLIEKGKLGLEPGPKYGPGGEGFLRMNLACTRETLQDGLQRLKIALS